MKKYIITLILAFCFQFGFSQAFELQLVLDADANTLSVQMRNVSSATNNPATGQTISTISFEMTGEDLVTGVASTDYTLLAPTASGQVIMQSTSLPAPEDWPMMEWKEVAVYNVDPASTVADFVVTPDSDGDNSDPNDPVMSVLSADGFNQSVAIEETILPIILNQFFAVKQNRSAKLNWTTSLEINGSHFEVERSQDGQNWSFIGKVAAVGESVSDQEYSYLDDQIPHNLRAEQPFYYKLKMVDNDGAFEYSDIRRVVFDLEAAEMMVYPNPTADQVFVNLSTISEETGPATLYVLNQSGQVVKKVSLKTNDDILVDVSTMRSGMYNFTIKQNDKVYTQRVIKIN